MDWGGDLGCEGEGEGVGAGEGDGCCCGVGSFGEFGDDLGGGRVFGDGEIVVWRSGANGVGGGEAGGGKDCGEVDEVLAEVAGAFGVVEIGGEWPEDWERVDDGFGGTEGVGGLGAEGEDLGVGVTEEDAETEGDTFGEGLVGASGELWLFVHFCIRDLRE